MPRSYSTPGLRLAAGAAEPREAVRDLQRDLRMLGYLAAGIDGVFGKGTEDAIRALQYDLLHNSGKGPDGQAPVAMRDYNRGRVTSPDGILEEKLAAILEEMIEDERFGKVPESADPAAENQKIRRGLAEMKPGLVPAPFLISILKQESGLRHFNEDGFVVVGLDRNASGKPAVTSRGFGVGQYTLFHHPPSQSEIADFVLDPLANVQKAARKLLDKFERFVNGNTPGTRADDRQAEFGRGPLRRCKYEPADPRYMTACRQGLAGVSRVDIRSGVTKLYDGASRCYEPSKSHVRTEYLGVPARNEIGCDWPYAARRYNGGGLDSYHYQTQVLLRVAGG